MAMREDTKADHKKMMARMDAWLRDTNVTREKTMACQENREARLEGKEEPTSEDREPEVAQEVPVEDAAVMPVREPRNRRRDRRNLAGGRRQKQQNRNLDARRRRKQQDLVAARRGTTRRAQVARHKENFVGSTGTRTTAYYKPRNDGRSGGDSGRNSNVTEE
jgi:hypothetical protein